MWEKRHQMRNYLPEGRTINSSRNKYYLQNADNLELAMRQGLTLEGHAVMCTQDHDIIVDLPFGKGIIPRSEGAIGIEEGVTRDIALLSRVNKTVCFKIMSIGEESGGIVCRLSRRLAQQECIDEYISKLSKGDVIPAKVTHLEPFGCFADIGCGIVSLIPIDAVSVSRISHPNDRFFNGQDIFAVVKDISQGRITLSHKELLGTWEQNAEMFSVGETVCGTVRSIEPYGIFIELTPNLAGLAEPQENVHIGQSASVFIKALIPSKMKVKLIIVDVFDRPDLPGSINYFIDHGHIETWVYSTENSEKHIYTDFT